MEVAPLSLKAKCGGVVELALPFALVEPCHGLSPNRLGRCNGDKLNGLLGPRGFPGLAEQMLKVTCC